MLWKYPTKWGESRKSLLWLTVCVLPAPYTEKICIGGRRKQNEHGSKASVAARHIRLDKEGKRWMVHTSGVLKMANRTGSNCFWIGNKWSSDISSPPNSENICRAPCIASGEPDVKRVISELRSSGYSSGQSQDAIFERIWDWATISIDGSDKVTAVRTYRICPDFTVAVW